MKRISKTRSSSCRLLLFTRRTSRFVRLSRCRCTSCRERASSLIWKSARVSLPTFWECRGSWARRKKQNESKDSIAGSMNIKCSNSRVSRNKNSKWRNRKLLSFKNCFMTTTNAKQTKLRRRTLKSCPSERISREMATVENSQRLLCFQKVSLWQLIVFSTIKKKISHCQLSSNK